ncbi:MAG: redoxin family protein [Planctomycetota bacterium]
MKTCHLVVAILLSSFGASAGGEESTELAKKYQRIQADYDEARRKFTESIRTGKMNRQIIPAAVTQRKGDLEELAKEAESLDPAKFTMADRETLAQVYQGLERHKEAIEQARAALKENSDNPKLHILLVTTLSNVDLDEAEKALAEAYEKCSDDAPLDSLHGVLYRANLKQHRPVIAADHLMALQDKLRVSLKSPQQLSVYLKQLDQIVDAYLQGNENEKAIQAIDHELAEIEKLDAEQLEGELEAAVTELEAKKIVTLGLKAGRQAEAEALADKLVADAEEAFQKSPDDAQVLVRLATLRKAKVDILADSKKEEESDLWIAFVQEQIGKHPRNEALVRLYLAHALQVVQRLSQEDKYEEADRFQASMKLVLDSLPAETAKSPAILTQKGSINSLLRRMESKRLHRDLIGKPMIPLTVSAWVNGSPMSNEDLRGRVVLLDFWAVWCGPCRATFPHLTQWHEKYADKGLVIVGLTQYHGYGWDDKAQSHVRVNNISEADEQAAVAKFAEHHGLKHRLAYIPKGSDLSRSYGVYGIPQAVLVDREGKIRLICIGSGEKNAQDLEAAIEVSLGVTPNAASGSGP